MLAKQLIPYMLLFDGKICRFVYTLCTSQTKEVYFCSKNNKIWMQELKQLLRILRLLDGL